MSNAKINMFKCNIDMKYLTLEKCFLYVFVFTILNQKHNQLQKSVIKLAEHTTGAHLPDICIQQNVITSMYVDTNKYDSNYIFIFCPNLKKWKREGKEV